MKILITGDFCPINRGGETLENGSLFESLKDIISEADLRITNLECPLTDCKTSIPKTGPALKSSPKYASMLKRGGFNMVTLANNHIMDYGGEGLKDTIDELIKSDIDFIGAGSADGEIDVLYKEHDGLKVAIVNLCENEWSTQEMNGYKANGFSEISAFYSLKKARENADKVIVIHHGGHEMYNFPSPRMKRVFRYFIDCGADAVINHHTHCVGGYEVYNGNPIFYSLGNFVFDKADKQNSLWNYGMAVVLTLKKDFINFEVHYFNQFSEEPTLTLVEESDLPYNLEEINRIIGDDILIEEKFHKFMLNSSKMYNSYLEPIRSKHYLALKNRGFLPSIWNKRKRLYLQNLIKCESHREVIIKMLENENSHTQK